MALRIRFAHPLRAFEVAVDLTVDEGETFALVGPSGAGKTTVLRVAGGLLRPQRGLVTLQGSVLLDTERGLDVPPERRRVGYLFQEYALFPHLDVAGNVRFGARDRRRVPALLERLRIADLAHAPVGQLSGGERQRVALARALAREPAYLLLDEPLSALDAHTRARVRGELRDLLAEERLPTVLVTHDFEDAAMLAERIGVIAAGRIVQVGTPSDLVATPLDPFVASLTGATLLRGQAVGGEHGLTRVILDGGVALWSTDEAKGPVDVAVYPWDVAIGPAGRADSRSNHVHGTVLSLARLGNRVRVRVGPVVAEITAASAERLDLRLGAPVTASFKATAARLFPRAPARGGEEPAPRGGAGEA
ncbi:MAG TPA: ABC transporter ATP-binding protein [Gaiellaceae bacterium]|nr:ABC transporter ATP-binding protein [Gaiellaceae bacterium]